MAKANIKGMKNIKNFKDGHLSKLIQNSEEVRIIRSGYVPNQISDLAEIITKACASDKDEKHIMIILPDVQSFDFDQRLRDLAIDKDREKISSTIINWCKNLETLDTKLAPGQRVEVRISTRPYRYMGFCGDEILYFSPAFHFKPTMSKVICIPKERTLDKFFRDPFLEDFALLWKESAENQISSSPKCESLKLCRLSQLFDHENSKPRKLVLWIDRISLTATIGDKKQVALTEREFNMLDKIRNKIGGYVYLKNMPTNEGWHVGRWHQCARSIKKKFSPCEIIEGHPGGDGGYKLTEHCFE
jgi:hypothetical protein